MIQAIRQVQSTCTVCLIEASITFLEQNLKKKFMISNNFYGHARATCIIIISYQLHG